MACLFTKKLNHMSIFGELSGAGIVESFVSGRENFLYAFNFLGFQIFSTQHKVCVTVDSSDNVTVARCDTGNVDQRWTWINHDQLLHKSTGRCLAVGELDIVFS